MKIYSVRHHSFILTSFGHLAPYQISVRSLDSLPPGFPPHLRTIKNQTSSLYTHVHVWERSKAYCSATQQAIGCRGWSSALSRYSAFPAVCSIEHCSVCGGINVERFMSVLQDTRNTEQPLRPTLHVLATRESLQRHNDQRSRKAK